MPLLANCNIPTSSTEDGLAERPPRPVRPSVIDLRVTLRLTREFIITLISVVEESALQSSDEEVTCSG